jgi:preprotein translocase subunit YajC
MYEAPFWTQAVPVVGAFLIFYLLIIRPGRIKEGERRKSVLALKPGDEVITNSGLKGQFVSSDVVTNSVLIALTDNMTIAVTHDGIEKTIPKITDITTELETEKTPIA